MLQDYYDSHACRLPSSEQAQIALNHLTGFYGASSVDKINPGTLEQYIERRRAKAGNETISRELSVLRAALNRAVRHGRLARAPHIPTLPKAPARERVLSRGEAARLLGACRRIPHLALAVRLLLYTGARPGAVLDLTWDRVDLERRLIFYPLPGRTDSHKRRAVVPIEGALYTALDRAKARAKVRHVVVWHGEPVKSFKKAFRQAVGRAGLEGVTPYTLRHTAATWAVQAGVELFAVGRLLGHSRISTTERYAKHSPEYLRGAARAILRAKSAPKPKK